MELHSNIQKHENDVDKLAKECAEYEDKKADVEEELEKLKREQPIALIESKYLSNSVICFIPLITNNFYRNEGACSGFGTHFEKFCSPTGIQYPFSYSIFCRKPCSS